MAERKLQKENSDEGVLAEQVRGLLGKIGITNITVDSDGRICGEAHHLTYYPTTHYLTGIHLDVADGKIVVNAEEVRSSERTGSVI